MPLEQHKTPTIDSAMETVCKQQPFLSAMVYSLKPVEAEYIDTMGTDGEFLFWNPNFLKTLSQEEAAAVIYHEVLHCAFRHMWRVGTREKQRFNIACDYAINPTVNESFALPHGALIDRKYFNLDAETIYKRLPQPPKQQKGKNKKQSNSGGSGNNSKKNNNNSSGNSKLKEQPWGDHSFWGEEGKKKKEEIEKKRSIGDKLTGKNKIPQSQKTESQKEREWDELFSENIAEQYGKLPSGLKRLVESTHNVPVIDWASLVQQLLSVDESDYNFSRPDRRFIDSEFVIPGLYSQEKLQDVIFAYDTSGSISQEDLRDFYHETLNLFDNFSNIQGWIGVCDAKVHDFLEINIEKEFKDIEFRGGGGTDFKPIFSEIEKRNLNPKAVFYFTDLEGQFPKEPDYPVFWLVKSEITEKKYYYVPEVPFGKVIEFMPGKGTK